jgi:L-seryl-tRNA(Ser) seleniumtransferase
VVGRADLIRRMNDNPLKRALRLDKGRLAALEQVLLLYLNPDRLAEALPSLRLLTRPADQIRRTAEHLTTAIREAWPDRQVEVEPCQSQIGSGALPVNLLHSWAVTVADGATDALAARLRGLPRPVIGRIADGRVWLDCRCVEPADEVAFVAQLPRAADTM